SGIGSTGKAYRQCLPNRRMRAVAASKIGRFAGLLRAVWPLEHHSYACGALIETDQLSAALDSHSQSVQPVDQQALVGVLRVGQGIRERAQSRSHTPEEYARGLGALGPEVEARNLDAGLDD